VQRLHVYVHASDLKRAAECIQLDASANARHEKKTTLATSISRAELLENRFIE
jgi:hypothetical protein